MERHAAVAQQVAAEVRAEMARQNKRNTELAQVLDVTPGTAGRKVAGRVEFTLTELFQVAQWLTVPLQNLYPDAAAVESA